MSVMLSSQLATAAGARAVQGRTARRGPAPVAHSNGAAGARSISASTASSSAAAAVAAGSSSTAAVRRHHNNNNISNSRALRGSVACSADAAAAAPSGDAEPAPETKKQMSTFVVGILWFFGHQLIGVGNDVIMKYTGSTLGRAWPISPASSSTHTVNPRSNSVIAFSDVASDTCPALNVGVAQVVFLRFAFATLTAGPHCLLVVRRYTITASPSLA
jgi:hypothetical protein